MKKIISTVLVCVLLVGCLFSLTSCGKRISGTYEGELNLGVVSGSVTYTFSGINTVTLEAKIKTILGNVETTEYKGTYEIAENSDGTMEITFEYESEGEYVAKNGTYTFEEGEDFIKIGIVKYTKVEK